jgi:3-isopropylmalate dehydrogenase
MGRTLRVATIAGDGIGPEVIRAALPALERAAALDDASIAWEHLPLGATHYLATGETLPESTFEHLRDDVDAILLGALGDPRVPDNEHARDILLGLRFRLDLYINFRPVRLYHPDHEIHTAPKVARILRAAFQWAEAHGRTRVTMADKSNAIPVHRLWQRLFHQIGDEFPRIEREHRYIDALAMEFVRAPERFQVVVTNNLYGDILSDLGAGLVGGLGMAASANLHPGRPGLFEPVHGSAPAIAGKGTANPMAACLTGALMFEQLGFSRAAARLEQAVVRTLFAGIRTPDIGGAASTEEVAAAVEKAVGQAAG